MPIIHALLRLFTSTTFLSAVLSFATQIVCAKQGVELPIEAVAAVPLAVAWKEGKRHEARGEICAQFLSQCEPTADAIEQSERAAAVMLRPPLKN